MKPPSTMAAKTTTIPKRARSDMTVNSRGVVSEYVVGPRSGPSHSSSRAVTGPGASCVS